MATGMTDWQTFCDRYNADVVGGGMTLRAFAKKHGWTVDHVNNLVRRIRAVQKQVGVEVIPPAYGGETLQEFLERKRNESESNSETEPTSNGLGEQRKATG